MELYNLDRYDFVWMIIMMMIIVVITATRGRDNAAYYCPSEDEAKCYLLCEATWHTPTPTLTRTHTNFLSGWVRECVYGMDEKERGGAGREMVGGKGRPGSVFPGNVA